METKTLNKDLIKVGQNFELDFKFGSPKYRFSIDRSNKLQIIRHGGPHMCYVTDVREDGIELALYIMGKQFTSFMAYSEMIYVKPSK
ncbi:MULTISPECIES: hypothetical protein [Sphingobacterium]|uniref:hypothetical protein n=1 Tax=Sphingobacterium TaxID=28453 RepID=UPI000ECD1304|nr:MULTISPECIES: hypothetical protein [Sphingobacterium]HAF34221.1 hypothetical protein [Sphingobacterium sp.]